MSHFWGPLQFSSPGFPGFFATVKTHAKPRTPSTNPWNNRGKIRCFLRCSHRSPVFRGAGRCPPPGFSVSFTVTSERKNCGNLRILRGTRDAERLTDSQREKRANTRKITLETHGGNSE